MTIFEWQANMAERQAGFLAHWVKCTKEEWLDKSPEIGPESKARTVLEQIGECIRVNRRAAARLRGVEPGESAAAELTVDEACNELIVSAKEYADAVRAQDESVFGKKYTMPFGEVDGAFMISIPILNMNYHGGAINYLQTLYGDTEFHIPGR